MNLTFESSPRYSKESGDGVVRQKNAGAYYTPYWLAHRLVKMCLKKIEFKKNLKLIDPACGEGVFLVAAADILINDFGTTPKLAAKIIYGADIDNEACIKARGNLIEFLISHAETSDFKEIREIVNKNIKHCDSLKYFQNDTDERFDAVVGNPPWRIQRNRREFDELTGASNFKRKTTRDLVEAKLNWQLKTSPIDSDDSDIYLSFIKLAQLLKEKSGCIGYILPDSFLLNSNAHDLRNNILSNCSVLIEGYINSKKAFDADSRKKFQVFISHSNSKKNKIEIAFGGHAGRTSNESSIPKLFPISISTIKKFSRKLIIPDLRSLEELSILEKCIANEGRLKDYLNDKVSSESRSSKKFIRGADIQFMDFGSDVSFDSEIIWRKITKDDNTRTFLVNLIRHSQSYDKNSVHKIGCKNKANLFSAFGFMNSTICDFLLKTQITVNATRESILDLPCPDLDSPVLRQIGLIYAIGIFKIQEREILNSFSKFELSKAKKAVQKLQNRSMIALYNYCELELCSYLKINPTEYKKLQLERFRSFNNKYLEAA